MKKVFLIGLISFLASTNIQSNEDRLWYIENARQYENNIIEDRKGTTRWQWYDNNDLGDTSQMTEGEIAELEALLSKDTRSAPLGNSTEFKFDYYFSSNPDEIYQIIEFNHEMYIVTWYKEEVQSFEGVAYLE